MTALSEHLKSVAIAQGSREAVASAFKKRLREYGSVRQTELTGWLDVKRYLLPLKSFPTRYVCLESGGWTQIVSDRQCKSGLVDVLFVSTTWS